MAEKLYMIEKVHKFVVMAESEDAALRGAQDVICDDLHTRSELSMRVTSQITGPYLLPDQILHTVPFSGYRVCSYCGEETDESPGTVAEILARRESAVRESGRTHFVGDGCDPPHALPASS